MRIDIESWLRRPKIDVHCHVRPMPDTDASGDDLIASGDAVGVAEFWCSRPISGDRLASIEEVRRPSALQDEVAGEVMLLS